MPLQKRAPKNTMQGQIAGKRIKPLAKSEVECLKRSVRERRQKLFKWIDVHVENKGERRFMKEFLDTYIRHRGIPSPKEMHKMFPKLDANWKGLKR